MGKCSANQNTRLSDPSTFDERPSVVVATHISASIGRSVIGSGPPTRGLRFPSLARGFARVPLVACTQSGCRVACICARLHGFVSRWVPGRDISHTSASPRSLDARTNTAPSSQQQRRQSVLKACTLHTLLRHSVPRYRVKLTNITQHGELIEHSTPEGQSLHIDPGRVCAADNGSMRPCPMEARLSALSRAPTTNPFGRTVRVGW